MDQCTSENRLQMITFEILRNKEHKSQSKCQAASS